MSWIAVAEPNAATPANPTAPPTDTSCATGTDTFLMRGSLHLEADLGRAHLKEGTLVLMHCPGETPRHLSIQITPGGHVVLAHRMGRHRYQVTLDRGAMHLSGRIRLTLSWNVPAHWGLISLAEAANGALIQKEFTDPLPLSRGDADHLAQGGAGVHFHPGVDCLAISDRLMPVGVSPSFAAGTPLRTPGGHTAVEQLRPGDLVETRDNGAQPIRWIGAHEVPACGQAAPVQLFAPYLGLLRDVIVAPDQRLLMAGAEVEYLFGEEEVLIEAQGLCQSPFAAPRRGQKVMRYFQVLLDRHEILEAAGCPMESLFIGRLREMPEVQATTILSGIKAVNLPCHTGLARRALRDFEAATLRAALMSR
ncbi:MAG: Hint domain-containing protein [Rhodobacteraceae bacterium]|nr:Hint domain-containing protein [Paracoccaceae bacterium]